MYILKIIKYSSPLIRNTIHYIPQISEDYGNFIRLGFCLCSSHMSQTINNYLRVTFRASSLYAVEALRGVVWCGVGCWVLGCGAKV